MDPVDLTNLRDMTDGDEELERTLFEEFFRSSEKNLTTLRASTQNADQEAWRTTAHAFKGISLNLGAMYLGGLCCTAQEESASSSERKAELLSEIDVEYHIVKRFLADLAPHGA